MAAIVGIGITMASVIVPARRAGQDPADRRDATGTRLHRDPDEAAVLGVVLTALGDRDVPDRAVPQARRHPGPDPLRRRRRAHPLPRRGVACRRRSPGRSHAPSAGRSRSCSRRRACSPADNVGRSPRRTSSSAAALMIGVALVSAAAVFAASLRATFVETLEQAVNADYVITDESASTGLAPDRRRDARRGTGAVRRHPGPRHEGRGRRRVRSRSARSIPWRSNSWSTPT